VLLALGDICFVLFYQKYNESINIAKQISINIAEGKLHLIPLIHSPHQFIFQCVKEGVIQLFDNFHRVIGFANT